MDSSRARQLFAEYDAAMAYIDVEDENGDRGIGSAFHVGEGVFVTARHVVERKKILEVRLTESLSLPTLDYFRDIEEYPDAEARAAEYEAAFKESDTRPPLWRYYQPPLHISAGPCFAADHRLDVAVFKVHDIHPTTPVIMLGNHWDDWIFRYQWQLSDAIILGYPPIPMARSPVLVAARAEVHTFIQPQHTQAVHFILSATPRGGFSGGVAIHEEGFALGLVTSSMVKQGDPAELGFFAVLSIEAIVACLSENDLMPHVQIKHFDSLHGIDTAGVIRAIGDMGKAAADKARPKTG